MPPPEVTRSWRASTPRPQRARRPRPWMPLLPISPVAPVPEPVPVALEVEVVAHERTIGRRALPHRRSRRRRPGPTGRACRPGRSASASDGSMLPGEPDLADRAGLDVGDRVLDVRHAPPLGADPTWTTRLYFRASRLDHPPSFDDIMPAGRLLGVDASLPGLAGEDGEQGVPVVGGRDGDGVDRLVVQEPAEVLLGLRRLAAGLLDRLDRPGERGVVDVAEGDDLGILLPGELGRQVLAPPADADDGDPDPLPRRRPLRLVSRPARHPPGPAAHWEDPPVDRHQV